MIIKNLKKLLAISVLFTLSNLTFASCDNSLAYDELIDCITAEGAGQNYGDYLEETSQYQTDEDE